MISAVGGLIAAVLWLAAISLLYQANPGQLQLEIAKALLQLAVVVIAAGVARVLIDRYAEARASREALRTRRIDALNALTAGYFEVKKAIHLIHGYGTIEVYGEQIQLIIAQRYVLQRLANEVGAGQYDLVNDAAVETALEDLDTQLRHLIDEWREQYPVLGTVDVREVRARMEALDVLLHIRDNRYAALHDPFVRAATPFRVALAIGRNPPRGDSRTSN